MCSFRRVVCRNMSEDEKSRRSAGSAGHRSDSIFSSRDATWDHIFSDVEQVPPQIPTSSRLGNTSAGPRRPRRQTMTAHEINAFNEIFNLIFESMSEKESGHSSPIPTGSTGMEDLFGTLRRHSKRMKWTAASDEELDRKKDEIDKCQTDQQLLEWAMREVFGESQSYEEEFRKAKAADTDSLIELPMLQSPTYPHLVALIMRTFRDKYRDPHLALSMFDYARHLSIASYVFGCSTSAYNELIATRWDFFRDLKGVHDALEEMMVNGVDMDNRTLGLVEKVRQEVGERNLWLEENGAGTGEVWEMLTNMERLVSRAVSNDTKPKRKKSGPWNDWKASAVDQVDSDWEFDKW
ncbi:hypothetical protein B0H10DRAFT_670640 [Mycena sp. CBHHK59/15]|nr:hypothetical protein B0H10DRAFT_670640 [Mycena sp. CBHHK59/15]